MSSLINSNTGLTFAVQKRLQFQTQIGTASLDVSGFSPANIPGLKLWFDFSNQASITLGTGISQIKDLSGNSNNASQVTGSAQPTQQLADQNGLNAAKFTSAGSQVLNYSSITLVNGISVFAVAKRTSIVNLFGASSGNDIFLQWFSDQKIYATNQTGYVVSPAESNSGYNLISSICPLTGLTGNVFLNRNNVTASNTVLAFGLTTTALGEQGGGTFSDGFIGECLLYDAILTASQQQLVQNYLRNKWATP